MRTRGLEEQKPYPEVCRLVAPGPPFRWRARGLGVLGSWGGLAPPAWTRIPLGAPALCPASKSTEGSPDPAHDQSGYRLANICILERLGQVWPASRSTKRWSDFRNVTNTVLGAVGSRSLADNTCSSRGCDEILMFDAQWCCAPDGGSTSNCAASLPFATCTARPVDSTTTPGHT